MFEDLKACTEMLVELLSQAKKGNGMAASRASKILRIRGANNTTIEAFFLTHAGIDRFELLKLLRSARTDTPKEPTP